MGTMRQVNCEKCGISGEVFEGVGFRGVRQVPIVCRACGQPGSYSGRKKVCEACDSKDVELLDMDRSEELGQCRKPGCDGALVVTGFGLWD